MYCSACTIVQLNDGYENEVNVYRILPGIHSNSLLCFLHC